MNAATAAGLARRGAGRAVCSTWGAAILLGTVACRTGPRQPEPHPEVSRRGRPDSATTASDLRASYRRAGLLVASGEIPFVGSIAFLAGPQPESTMVLVNVSLSDHVLTFTREGERYRAAYDVRLDLAPREPPARHLATHEEVRVGTVTETTREEESIIYQQVVFLPPGAAAISISIRDAGSTRAGVARETVSVPRFDDGTVAAPIPALRARPRASRDKLPEIVVNPRASAISGRDSIALFYLEAYGPSVNASGAVQLQVMGEGDVPVYVDTVPWTETGNRLRSAILTVPIARVGFGELSLSVSGIYQRTTVTQPAVRAPLLVRPRSSPR